MHTFRRLVSALLLVAAPGWAATVALLTDYGTSDHYAGVLAGSILAVAPDAQLVTITHEVPAYDVREGSYLLALAAAEFPPHTVFVAIVDPGVGTTRRPVALETNDGKLFVGPDNGLFTGVLDRLGLAHAFTITNDALTRTGVRSVTFHGRDIFGPVAGHLAAGTRRNQVGPATTDLVRLPSQAARLAHGKIDGEVVHVDHYGNLLTNIPAELLDQLGVTPDHLVTLRLGTQTVSAPRVLTYGAVPRGALALVVNSEGRAEIACNQRSAAARLGARAGATVSIRRR